MVNRNNFLFEISWEICNKVGGIYTVVASKSALAKKNFSNYYCVGPYLENSKNEFEEIEIPDEFKEKVLGLEKIGIKVYFGKWTLDEDVDVILVDSKNFSKHINEVKTKLWDLYKIDSLETSWYDFDEVILWSWCTGIVIESLTKDFIEKVLVHSHEWMAGGAIFYLNSLNNDLYKTIFTTHATMLGRSICGNGKNLYSILEDSNLNPDELAKKFGVKTKFETERVLSKISDSFTTVSDITAKEANKFYGNGVDCVLYNGFDNIKDLDSTFLTFRNSRKKVNSFLRSYFYDSYDFDCDKTFLFYTSGRYEIRNKGIDLLVEALSNLNKRLKKENFNGEVVFWFMLMFGEYDYYLKYKESLLHEKSGILSEKNGFAPLSPFDLGNNDVIDLFLKNKLFNSKNDKVKVILTPNNLDNKNSLISLNYYDLISGFDLGLFPSFYEPWGYTPVESLANGVSAITTNLCGVGKYSQELNFDLSSLKVVDRISKDSNGVEKLTDEMYSYLKKSSIEKFELKKRAKLDSTNFSWEKFYLNYLKAYDLALNK